MKTMLGRAIALLACVSLAACTTGYGRFRPGTIGGYRDQLIAPDTWVITATTNNGDHRGKSIAMALYRAAELSRGTGKEFFQVSGGQNVTNLLSLSYGGAGGFYEGQDARVTVHAIASRSDAEPCGDPASCPVLSVQETMDRFGPELKIKPRKH